NRRIHKPPSSCRNKKSQNKTQISFFSARRSPGTSPSPPIYRSLRTSARLPADI
uniref:Uncharacterized protein n=1 Tax=Aegilops tauschii subsp. strangulata TaxID=200361 RepID=A0A452XPR7_AEGTS